RGRRLSGTPVRDVFGFRLLGRGAAGARSLFAVRRTRRGRAFARALARSTEHEPDPEPEGGEQRAQDGDAFHDLAPAYESSEARPRTDEHASSASPDRHRELVALGEFP